MDDVNELSEEESEIVDNLIREAKRRQALDEIELPLLRYKLATVRASRFFSNGSW